MNSFVHHYEWAIIAIVIVLVLFAVLMIATRPHKEESYEGNVMVQEDEPEDESEESEAVCGECDEYLTVTPIPGQNWEIDICQDDGAAFLWPEDIAHFAAVAGLPSDTSTAEVLRVFMERARRPLYAVDSPAPQS